MITPPLNTSKIIDKHYDSLQNKVNDIAKQIEQRALNEEWTEKAINQFGTTNSPYETGYILYNGQMLDFSGGVPNTKQIDHAEIEEIFTEEEIDESNDKYIYSGIIQLFQIYSNAIRIDIGVNDKIMFISFHYNHNITQSQIRTLKYIESICNITSIIYDVNASDGYSLMSNKVNSVKELETKLSKYIQDYN